jgi:hypothetical protein
VNKIPNYPINNTGARHKTETWEEEESREYNSSKD